MCHLYLYGLIVFYFVLWFIIQFYFLKITPAFAFGNSLFGSHFPLKYYHHWGILFLALSYIFLLQDAPSSPCIILFMYLISSCSWEPLFLLLKNGIWIQVLGAKCDYCQSSIDAPGPSQMIKRGLLYECTKLCIYIYVQILLYVHIYIYNKLNMASYWYIQFKCITTWIILAFSCLLVTSQQWGI